MITEYLAKATENLQAGEMLFEAGLHNASANRAYYAAFHAAIATIFEKGLQVNTDHAKVQATFNGEVIRRSKYITKEYKRYLPEMQNIRNYADYRSEAINKRTAKLQLTMAQNFVSIIIKEVQP